MYSRPSPQQKKKSGRIGVFVQPRSQGAFTSKARGKRPGDEVGRCRAVVDCVPEKLYKLSFFRLQFKKMFSGQHDSCTARTYPTLACSTYNLGKNRRKIYTPRPPPPLPQPKSKMAKWRALAFDRLHSWFRGGGGGEMGFCCPILFCPRLKKVFHLSFSFGGHEAELFPDFLWFLFKFGSDRISPFRDFFLSYY